jgi:hypothetical protein
VLYLLRHPASPNQYLFIAGSYGRSMFSFLRSLHTVFHSGCTNSHSHQQWMRVPFPLHSYQHVVLFVFLMVAILTGARWIFNMVLICISFTWPGMLSISPCVLWPFGLFPSRKFYSVHLPISPLGHWYFESLVFWVGRTFLLNSNPITISTHSHMWASKLFKPGESQVQLKYVLNMPRVLPP